jgi:hypothetical protein
VHPTLGILARFQAFFYASAFSQSDGVPPPAPARVTQTVRRQRQIVMLDIVLDTSVFRNDPWHSKADFLALQRLARAKKIKLHVPYFVHREFLSHMFSEHLDSTIIPIERAVSKLKKNLPEEFSAKLLSLEEQFLELKNDIANYPEQEFNDWLKSIGAVIHPIANDHGLTVANAYFDGTPPFREKKKRDDFPDAFIWQTIYDLSNNVTQLYAVVNDKGLRSACETKENIVLFDSLADFLASDICSQLLVEENLREEISELLKLIPFLEARLKETVSDQISDIVYGEEVESTWIPEDNNTAMCLGLEKIDSLEIETEDALYYGDGAIVVKFSMLADALLGYAIFKADYHSIEDKRLEGISISPLNKHYDDAEEVLPLEISGKLSLEVPLSVLKAKNLTEEDVDNILESMVITVEEMDVSEDVWSLWR